MTNVINDTKRDWWSSIDWIKVNKVVNNLQRRIFEAKQQGNFRKLRKLQNLLLSSQCNKLVSISYVIETNFAQKTGNSKENGITEIDMVEKLYKMAFNIDHVSFNSPVCVNKPFHTTNVVILAEKTFQAIVLNALEPEFQTEYNCLSLKKNSNFAHDAIGQLDTISPGGFCKHWVLSVPLKSCTSHICDQLIKNQYSHFPANKWVFKWLKELYFDYGTVRTMHIWPNAIISPLLAQITVHGLKEAILLHKDIYFEPKFKIIQSLNDFIIVCESKQDALYIQNKVNCWLTLDSIFQKEKTTIAHFCQGFDWLGFHIKLQPFKQTTKLFIWPSLQSEVKLKKKLKQVWKNHLGSPVTKVIKAINPILKVWANYFKICVCSRAFATIDYFNWIRQYRFARRTHPNKSLHWIKRKYWGKFCPNRNDQWVFGSSLLFMYKLSWTLCK